MTFWLLAEVLEVNLLILEVDFFKLLADFPPQLPDLEDGRFFSCLELSLAKLELSLASLFGGDEVGEDDGVNGVGAFSCCR